MTEPRDELFIDEALDESFPASDAPAWTESHAGPPLHRPPRMDTPRLVRSRLRADVDALALGIGERHDQTPAARKNLALAADYIANAFLEAGRVVTRTPLPSDAGVENIEIVLTGADPKAPELVVGAHYDTVEGGPGANDDASGVAVLLALSRLLEGRRFASTVRLVAFANEEAPHRAKAMGSYAYANRLHDRGVQLRGMLSVDSVGFFAGQKNSEERSRLAKLFSRVPSDFIAFVGDRASRDLVLSSKRAFGHATRLPVRAFVLPRFLPFVASSDHRSFWKFGYPAMMVTDTGPLRYRRHHTRRDLPGHLDYDKMADLVFGIAAVLARLSGDKARH